VTSIERLVSQVMDAHGCHTAIVYGSRARGDATPDSDLDLLCVREGGVAFRDARVVDGVYLDAFIYPESALATLDPAFLRILGGTVVRERDGFGTALLARVREMHDRGPPETPEDERRALVVWSQKMLDRVRARANDVAANYRRMQLLVRALEDYFALRGTWFRGEKEAFAWLRQHDAATYARFERAAEPSASDAALADLVRAVYRPDPSNG
jgi:hypothetical protein